MAIAHRGVGDEQALLRQHPVSHRLGAFLQQQITRAGGRRALQRRHDEFAACHLGLRATGGFRMSIHRNVGNVGEDLRGTITALLELEKFRRRVDELGGAAVVQKARVLQQVLDEGDVGRNSAHAEFRECTAHAGNGLVGRLCPCRDLDEQRVIKARDHGPCIGGAAVKPYAHARCRAIGCDAAIVWNEVVLRILGGDTALQCMAIEANVFLTRHARCDRQALAFGDQDLRPHDVDAGHLFGHRMFDLDPRVDLDKVEAPRIHVHEELDSAGAFIPNVGADTPAQVANLGALVGIEIGGRRPFHHFLVSPLHRAVALIEVIDRAILVAEDLHLDMARPLDHLLEIALAIAEG